MIAKCQFTKYHKNCINEVIFCIPFPCVCVCVCVCVIPESMAVIYRNNSVNIIPGMYDILIGSFILNYLPILVSSLIPISGTAYMATT